MDFKTQSWQLPPTTEYITSLSDDQLDTYLSFLAEDVLHGKYVGDFCVLFDPNEDRVSDVSSTIVKVLTYGNFPVPSGTDPYEIVFNFQQNPEFWSNYTKAYTQFIQTSPVFDQVFDQFVTDRGVSLTSCFTEHFLKSAVRSWLVNTVKEDLFSYDACHVIDGVCSFTDTSPRDALLTYIHSLADNILFGH